MDRDRVRYEYNEWPSIADRLLLWLKQSHVDRARLCKELAVVTKERDFWMAKAESFDWDRQEKSKEAKDAQQHEIETVAALAQELKLSEQIWHKARSLIMHLRRGDCWCECGIDNPMMHGKHSSRCDEIREFIRQMDQKDADAATEDRQ